MIARHIDKIIMHCAVTLPTWMQGRPVAEKVATIRDWHQNGRGWSDIGYHFVIDRDGAVGVGRPISRTGAHVVGHNTGSVGICLLGGKWEDLRDCSPDDHFNDHFTPEQGAAMYTMARLLTPHLTAPPGVRTLYGHNEFAPRGCPGFRVERLTVWPPKRFHGLLPPLPAEVEALRL